jgi:hypothetical protein
MKFLAILVKSDRVFMKRRSMARMDMALER